MTWSTAWVGCACALRGEEDGGDTWGTYVKLRVMSYPPLLSEVSTVLEGQWEVSIEMEVETGELADGAGDWRRWSGRDRCK